MPPNGVIPPVMAPHSGYGAGNARGGNSGDPRYHGDWSRDYPPETYRRSGGGNTAPPGVTSSSVSNVDYDRRPPPPQT